MAKLAVTEESINDIIFTRKEN